MKPEDTLQDVDALWRAMPQRPHQARPVADIDRRRRRQQLYLVAEMAVSLAGMGVGAFLILSGSVAIGVAAIVYSLFGGALGWWARGGNIDALSASVVEHLESRKAMLRARRNHNVGGVAMFLAAVVFYVYVRQSQTSAFTAWDMAILLLMAGMAGFYVRRAVQAQRQLGDYARQTASLGDDRLAED